MRIRPCLAAPIGRLLVSAVLVLTGTVLGSALHGQEPPEDYDGGIFEVRVSRDVNTSALVLQNPRGVILVPLVEILELTAIPYEQPNPGTVMVRRPDDRGTNRVEADTRSATVADSVINLPSREILVAFDDLYVTAAIASLLIDGTVEIDFASLTVLLRRDPPFPVEVRRQVERERERNELIAARVRPGRRPSVPLSSATGVGMLQWGVFSSAASSGQNLGARLRFGMALLGGELSLGGVAGVSAIGDDSGVTTGTEELLYRRVFPERRWIRQLHLGDFVALGMLGRSVRGVQISNVPYLRDPLYDDILLSPDLPEGWEYEIYHGGTLLGYSDGRMLDPVQVPLRYGSTPLRIRYLGPGGEERVSELNFYVPLQHLGAGRTEYATGLGACPLDRCDWYGFADVRRGIARWLTAGGGLELESDSSTTRGRPYAIASLLPSRDLAFEGRWVENGLVRFDGRYAPTRRSHVALGGGIERPGYRTGSFLPGGHDRWFFDASGAAPFDTPLGPFQSIRGSARVEGLSGERINRTRVSIAGGLRGGMVEARYESADVLQEPLVTLRATAVAFRRHSFLRTLYPTISGSVGASASGLAHLATGTRLAISQHGRLGLQTRWDRGEGVPSLTLSYTTRTGGMRIRGGLTADDGDRNRAHLSADGVVSYGRQAGLQVSERMHVGQAGIEGVVFHDRSGDGRFGPDDEPVANLPVTVGGRRTRTDERGRYRLWGVLPYEITSVAVDSARIPDPSWVASESEFLVRPVPNTYTRVDIPLVRTREVFGQLVSGPDIRVPSGVTIYLTSETGDTVARATTFSDGGYYIPRVRPGRYTLGISDASLRALQARAVPEEVHLLVGEPGADQFALEVPDIQLHRRGTEPVAQREPPDAVCLIEGRPVAIADDPADAAQPERLSPESFVLEGHEYLRFGLPEHRSGIELTHHGTVGDLPVLVGAAEEHPPPEVMLPTSESCIFQPYRLGSVVRAVRG